MRLYTLLKRLTRRHGGILCFHGIRDGEGSNEGNIHVSEDHIREILEVVGDLGEFVSVQEISQRLGYGKNVAGLIGITFDDAYVSLLGGAVKYILEKAIPITVFPVTEAARKGSRFWWDRIEELLPKLDPDQERKLLGGFFPDHNSSTIEKPRWPELRRWVLSEWAGRIGPDLDEVVSELEGEVGEGTIQRSMSFYEIDSLVRNPLVDLGVHTKSHPCLPKLRLEEFREEVSGAFFELRDRFDRVRPILAVPFGILDARTVPRAQDAGMDRVLSLSDFTLAHPGPGVALSRLPISSQLPTWKLAIKLTGLVETVRIIQGKKIDFQ